MRLQYIICTVKQKYQLPLNFLLDSMFVNKINMDNVFLSSQDTSSIYTNIETINYNRYNTNMKSVNIPKKLYEYSFFITCKELLDCGIASKTDLFMLMHDTSIVRPQHIKKINYIIDKYINKENYDIVYGNNTGQHNIGIYNYKSINVGYSLYKKLTVINKEHAINIEHNCCAKEHSIKQQTDKLKIFYPQIPWIESQGHIVYYSMIKRVVSSLQFFDIEKYYFNVQNGVLHPHDKF